MNKISLAFVAMFAFLVSLSFTAQAASPFVVDDQGDFGVSAVVEIPGTYPPVIRLYGGSTRSAVIAAAEFGVLTSNDGFQSPPTFQPITGVVGYEGSGVNTTIAPCPQGQTCGGYQAFYVLDKSGVNVYRCTGILNGVTLSGCSPFSVSGMTSVDAAGIGFNQDGAFLQLSGKSGVETNSSIFSTLLSAGTAFNLSTCSNPALSTTPTGSVVGTGLNQFLYVTYDDDYYRLPWNGTTCSGPREKVVGSMGWSDAINTPDGDYYAAVGNLTGSFYFSGDGNVLRVSKKDASCGDSFISQAEMCDPQAADPLNEQVCDSIGQGFTGGSLGCNPVTCQFDTTNCSVPVSCGNSFCDNDETCSSCPGDCGICCGNNLLDVGEPCEGTKFGAVTCESEMGSGYTGLLFCTASCTIDTAGCVPPIVPFCGDSTCNGAETCSTCSSDCGICCGNGQLDAGEACDGNKFGGKSCANMMPDHTGSLVCTADCSIDTSGCVLPSIEVLSGGCTVTENAFEGSIHTVNGLCSFSFTPKDGQTANTFKIEASGWKDVPFTIAALPNRSAFKIPQGIKWTEPETNGNKKLFVFGTGQGVLMGDEGTGFVFDTMSAYPEVSFEVLSKTICFGIGTYSPHWTAIDIGNGVETGCLSANWIVSINVETKSLVSGPTYEGGSTGSGGTGGSSSGGSETGGGGGDTTSSTGGGNTTTTTELETQFYVSGSGLIRCDCNISSLGDSSNDLSSFVFLALMAGVILVRRLRRRA